jgi:pimeloyl-ACP methyl ester carboxylesterase
MSWRQSLTILVCLAFPSVAIAQDKFFDSDGVKIHYIEQGTGAAVVLLHGQGNNVDLWSGIGLLQELSANYHVIAFDARGHGKSDKPHDPKLYGRQLALDAVRLMDHLQIRRAHVIGYSMGATTVSLLLTMQPDRFLTATLFAGPGRFQGVPEQDSEQEALEMERDCVSRTAILAGIQLNEPRPTDDDIKARSAACFANPTGDRFAMAALVRGRRDQVVTRDQVAAVRVPTLGLVGGFDPLAAGMRELKKLRPDMTLLVVEGGTHGRPGDERGILRQPAARQALREFLESHRQATP